MKHALLLACGAALAGCDGDPPPPHSSATVAISTPAAERLVAAGSGAATPLATCLGEAWTKGSLRVEGSVGSGGGILAAARGAVDVGLAARPLNADERATGLVSVPLARDGVVIAVNRRSAVDALRREELVALHAGTGDQRGVTLLLRDAAETGNDALDAVVPGLRAAREAAYRQRSLRVIYHDDEMAQALTTTPEALGLFSLGAISAWTLPLRPVAIDGVLPSLETLASGTWKASRILSLVFREDRRARVQALVDFATSPEGRSRIRACGYLPLETEP